MSGSAKPRAVAGVDVGSEPVADTPVVATPAKKKRTRSPSVAKPVFIVVQVLDDNGQPQAFDKRKLRILMTERSAEKVLEMTETGEHPNAFYMRVMLPAGIRTPTKPA